MNFLSEAKINNFDKILFMDNECSPGQIKQMIGLKGKDVYSIATFNNATTKINKGIIECWRMEYPKITLSDCKVYRVYTKKKNFDATKIFADFDKLYCKELRLVK